MKIAIIGATGNVGSRILAEAVRRGHAVTAIARDPSRFQGQAHVTPVPVDVTNHDALTRSLRGHDAIVVALRFDGTDAKALFQAVRDSAVKRFLVVGGAGSLEVAPGKVLVEQPGFPPEYKPEASAGKRFLDALRQQEDLEWTFLSPSALFIAGERTGNFRLGKDTLLHDGDGKSWISYEDFAIAMLDEIEQPVHVRQRFTIGY
jgi:putative NADH-flavin reductase